MENIEARLKKREHNDIFTPKRKQQWTDKVTLFPEFEEERGNVEIPEIIELENQ